MASRVATYVQLLYQHLIREEQVSRSTGLPPVFPIVLYNGDTPWQGATNLQSLIALPEFSPLWAWQPGMQYYIIEERCYPKERGDSLTGLLFEMENCRNSTQLGSVIERLARLVKKPSDAPLKRAFLKVIKAVLAQRRGINIQNENFSELSEVKEMLSTRLKQWEQEFKEKGLEEGREQGREHGLEQGLEQGR